MRPPRSQGQAEALAGMGVETVGAATGERVDMEAGRGEGDSEVAVTAVVKEDWVVTEEELEAKEGCVCTVAKEVGGEMAVARVVVAREGVTEVEAMEGGRGAAGRVAVVKAAVKVVAARGVATEVVRVAVVMEEAMEVEERAGVQAVVKEVAAKAEGLVGVLAVEEMVAAWEEAKAAVAKEEERGGVKAAGARVEALGVEMAEVEMAAGSAGEMEVVAMEAGLVAMGVARVAAGKEGGTEAETEEVVMVAGWAVAMVEKVALAVAMAVVARLGVTEVRMVVLAARVVKEGATWCMA